MPSDDEKKRWRVRRWGGSQADLGGQAEDLERVLNAFDEEGYEIYDVRYEGRMIVAKLKESDDDDLGLPMSIGDLLKQQGLEAVVSSLQQQQPPQMPQMPPPPPPVEDEGIREMREYKIQGVLTPEFMRNLRVVMYAADNGDPFVDRRLMQAINSTFAQAPYDEVMKTLSDVEFFKQMHVQRTCDDAHCASTKVYESTVEKLKARLAANPPS